MRYVIWLVLGLLALLAVGCSATVTLSAQWTIDNPMVQRQAEPSGA